jgi:hypothetical protein
MKVMVSRALQMIYRSKVIMVLKSRLRVGPTFLIITVLLLSKWSCKNELSYFNLG